MIFRHIPRILSLKSSFKHEHFPTESSNSMKSYVVNVIRIQDRTGAQNQHYVHSFSAHIRIPVMWVMSFQISLFSKFAHILHINFSKLAG